MRRNYTFRFISDDEIGIPVSEQSCEPIKCYSQREFDEQNEWLKSVEYAKMLDEIDKLAEKQKE